MKRIIFLTLAVILLLSATPLRAATAKAGEDEGEKIVTEEGEDILSEADEEQAFDIVPELLVEEGDYISTLPFVSNHYMVGLFSTINEGFYTGEWNIKDAQLSLSFSTTQLVSEVLSDITISINGVRFYSERVPVTDGNRRELTVKIPIEHISEGYNYISIEGYIRTYDGLPCVDDVTTANWMNIFNESFIEISYVPMQPCSNIDEFYSCFTSVEALENNQSAVIVPTGYDNDEIDAAFTILAGISRQATKNYNNIDLLAADKLTNVKDKKYVMYIAKPENLPEELAQAINVNGEVQGPDGGIFLIAGEVNTLIVIGESLTALDRTAVMLSDPVTMNQLKGVTKIIKEDEDIYIRKEGVEQYTQITEKGTYLDGPFRQKVDYYINFANNRKLTYGSEVELYFRYSDNLDFDRSLITVYVNNVPIGSQKLSDGKTEGDGVVFDIPTDIEVTGSFSVTVAFDLEIKDLWCTLRQSETPWAYISNESMLKLNSIEMPYFLFDNYPYPFISEGEFNDLAVIIPESNTDLDLNLMGDFMLTLGQYLKYNTGELSVARASSTGDLDDKNVITVGTYLNNQFIAGLNDDLFFRFYENGAGIMSNEKLYIEPSYSTALATAQIIQSPYSNSKNAILIMTSAKKEDIGNALKYFADTKELWNLYGDGFIADEDDIFRYRFKEENAKEEEAAATIFERTDVMHLLYVSGAIFTVLIIALAFMLIRYRRKQDYEKE